MGRVNKLIKAGDVVLIAGLYGDDVNFANNKLGYVQQIMTMENAGGLNFAAKVQLDLNTLLPINFVFLYNTETLKGVDNILLDSTFVNKYLKAKQSKHVGFITDGNGNNSAFIFGGDDTKHVFTISTLN